MCIVLTISIFMLLPIGVLSILLLCSNYEKKIEKLELTQDEREEIAGRKYHNTNRK